MIVSCGEALIDFVPARTTGGEPAYVPRPGGSPFNVALTVGRLGVRAGFLGSVSTDFFGAQLVAALAASGVDLGYVERIGAPTTLAFVNLDAPEPQYAFYDREAAPKLWAPSAPLGDDVTMLHLSFGALLPIDEPAANNFAQLLRGSHGRRIVALDPNVRQTVIAGREAAYRERLIAFLELADLIKISMADLQWLDPHAQPATVAAGWLAGGASLVLVTAGGDGSTAYASGGRVISCPAQPVVVVDTVGAGDSFMGGLLAGLDICGITDPDGLAHIDTATLETVVAFATRVSAITCGRAGADPPWRDEVVLPAVAGARKESS
jgi:fructokinase